MGVCTRFTTRAIHIEKLNSLETDTFINGFVRFVVRRGYPKRIWSDNGTNFVGAHAELTRVEWVEQRQSSGSRT